MEFTDISGLEILLGSLAITSYFYLGLAVYLRDPKSWTNRLFAFFILVLITYTVVNPISLHPIPSTQEGQLFWIRMVIFVVSPIGPVLFLLVHTFPHKEIRLRKNYILAIIAVALANAIASLTPLIFRSISYPGGQPVPLPGNGILIFVLNFPIMVFLAFGLLVKKYFRTTGEEKAKLFYFLAGILATFSLMVLLTITLVVVFKTSAGIFLGPISPVILASFIAYAIVKHRFLDIQPIIARAVSFIFLIIIFALIYSLVILFGIERLFNMKIEQSFFLVLLGLAIASMLAFQPMEKAIRKLTNRLFFQSQYDGNLLLAELTKLMAETIDLDYMTREMLGRITVKMNISKAAFLIIDDHKITSVKDVGNVDHENIIPELESLFHRNIKIDNCCTFEELDDGYLKDTFRKLNIFAAIPIKVEDKEVAILVLGIKRSGEVYYERDMLFLSTFASEAGIAIQNAKSYQKIKEFSKELEKKVEERTAELKTTQGRELEKARQVAKLKDEFVFIAAHELRTPVTAIRGFLELVSEATESFPKDVKQHLTSISEASEHLNQLINDLLQVSRSDSGTMVVNTVAVEVEPIVKTILKELKPTADKRKISINFVNEISRVSALADPKKLGEVLMNILSNAVKYNKDGGSIDVAVYNLDDRVIIEIKDTGFGIPADQQEKVFQKFFRAGTKGTEDVLGTGLGLFISKMLIEKMGGKLQFSSVEGKGSTFGILLPMAG